MLPPSHFEMIIAIFNLLKQPEKRTVTLKQQLESIDPVLREMRQRKQDRINQFRAVKEQIQKISAEIDGRPNIDESVSVTLNENDLSLKKLEEHKSELQRFLNKKSERFQQVESYLKTVQALSAVMEMDASMIITKIHPSLNEQCGVAKNISDTILEELNSRVESLRDEKQRRLLKLHQLGRELTDMWNLMDTPEKDREFFAHVIDLSSASPQEVNKTGSLALTIIQQAEAKVMGLDQLKASKMKELYLRKQFELEDVCARSHMEVPSKPDMDHIMKLITSGAANHDHLLKGIDDQIAKAKEEASHRKRLMAKIEKWIFARDEERWLEEYNRDENRYSVSKCVHKNLQRAERAQTAVGRIPALIDSLIAMTKRWEEEQKKTLTYDEVPLLVMLEEYNSLRQEKEADKQRKRLERKKVHRQVPTEPENLLSIRSSSGMRHISDRRLNGSPGNPSPLNNKIQPYSRQQRFSNIKPQPKQNV